MRTASAAMNNKPTRYELINDKNWKYFASTKRGFNVEVLLWPLIKHLKNVHQHYIVTN